MLMYGDAETFQGNTEEKKQHNFIYIHKYTHC